MNKDVVRDFCLDCGKPYSEFMLDTVLSNEQWYLIHPDKHGLLCSQCIVNRAEKLNGILRIDAVIVFVN